MDLIDCGVDDVRADFKEETRTFFEEKLKKISLTPMPFGVGVSEVLCATYR